MSEAATTVRLCDAGEIAPGSARRFDVEGHRVAVVRVGDDFYAIGDTCSHEDYSLSEGSTFSLDTGAPQTLPATSPVPVYEVRVSGTNLLLVLPPEPVFASPGHRIGGAATPKRDSAEGDRA